MPASFVTDPLFSSLLAAFCGGLISLFSATLATRIGLRAADRLPGESLWPSCFYCLTPMTYDVFLPLRGLLKRMDCRHCTGSSVALHHWRRHRLIIPAVEVTAFLLGLFAAMLGDFSVATFPLFVALGLLPAIAIVDMMFGIIPDGMNISLAALGILYLTFGDSSFFHGLLSFAIMLFIGLAFAFGYSRWRGRDMLGLGDVKFMAAASLWLSFQDIPIFLLISGLCGIVFGLCWRRFGGNAEFPFAPSLAAALTLCLLRQLYGIE
jgi:leader peptidase (prepilin peptidase) / N-methyltransferase